MQLPHDPRALAAALPDSPRWVETRSLLLSGRGVLRIGRAGDCAVVLDSQFPSGAVVGPADKELLQLVLADVPGNFELLVQASALDQAQQVLSGWTAAGVVVHSPTRPYQGIAGAQPGVLISAPAEERWLARLPEDIRVHAADAEVVAVKLVGANVVAICAASDVTETLWDVGIDTLEGHRRRGHATACFHALAAWMAARGRQPVWAAYEDYAPSLELAAKLGFQPVDRLAVLSRNSNPIP